MLYLCLLDFTETIYLRALYENLQIIRQYSINTIFVQTALVFMRNLSYEVSVKKQFYEQ